MNIFNNIDLNAKDEIFESIFENNNIRIERIISNGNITEEGFWYDQDENEWIILLQGEAELQYRDGEVIKLEKGDFELIPMNKKHRVSYTSLEEPTIWLAIFFK